MDLNNILPQSDKKPQKILKIVLSFSAALLVIWIFLVSRMEFSTTEKSAATPEMIERTEGLKTSLMRKDTAETVVTPAQDDRADDAFQNAATTFMVMIGLLGLVWFWSKKRSGKKDDRHESRELGDYQLGQGAQLKFVEVNNEVWVLGMTSGSLDLLHRVPISEWSEAKETAMDDKPEKPVADFANLYKMFRN